MRFFFNVHDGHPQTDDIGTELPDLAAAQTVAARMAAELLAPENHDRWRGDDWFIEVTNVSGVLIFAIKFSAMIRTAAND